MSCVNDNISRIEYRNKSVRPPGFEPGQEAWEASILTKLDHGRLAARLVSQDKKKVSA